MKKYLTIILTLALVFNTVPLNAQGIDVSQDIGISQEITISREQFIDTSAQIDAILAKEFNNYTIKNPEAAYKEFREILKWKSKQYDLSKAKTYRDKQTYRNRAFMPSISQKEKYPNSTYFKKEGDFYRYAIAARNASLERTTPLGYQDFQNHAENEMRRMFLQESKDENVLKEINLDNKRSPINDASYLAGYYAQNLAFTEAVREANLTLHSSDCQSPASKKDKDCIDAGILGQYNYKLFESANQNAIKHISTIAPMMDRCLSKVLAPLQAKKIALQEVEEYLDEHSNLPWESCGVDYDEARDLILGQTLTRAEAEDMIDNQGFGAKLLGSLDYISFSYYVNRASAIQDFKAGMEDGLEDMSNSEIYREAQISDILSNSLNKVLTQIASNYIAYGQVFYYDVEGFSGKSDKFAETWNKVGTNELYQNMPIAKLARDAITRSGRRGFQDKNLAKSMQEVRFENNAKSQVEILAIAADFVMDPTMLLAPIGETVKGLKLASKVAQTAPKTTAKVTKAAETVGKGVQTAKNAVVDSKVGRGVKKATQPIKQLKSKAGNFVYDAFDDFSDMGRHLDDGKTTKGLTKGAETTTDVVEDFAKAPTPKPEPTTALDPQKANPAKEFDDLVAKAGNTESNPKGCIGFNCKETNSTPTNTTTGAPEGTRRRIGFSQEPEYIPDNAGKGVTGEGGLQDFTKGNKGPQARGPEGPNARNPYDVRNSAGGPDTPGTPQQDLSDLNRQITNEPTITLEESKKLNRGRDSQAYRISGDKENYSQSTRFKASDFRKLDKQYAGTSQVTWIDDEYVEITKLNGEKFKAKATSFRAWLDGVPEVPELNISQKERDAIKGLDDFMSRNNVTVAKTQEIAQQTAKKAELQKKYSAMVDSYENMLYRVQPKSSSQRLKDEFRRMANGGRPHPKKLERLGLDKDVIDDIVRQDNNIRAVQSEIRKL